jgi:hypothetical protein
VAATYNDTSGLVTLQHQTDAASVEQLQIRGPDRATPAIGDEVFQSFYLEDAGGFEEQARITAALDVVTDAAEESSIRFDIQKAGTLTEAFIMGYDDTDGGTHLWGTSTYDGLLSQLGWASGEAGIGISQYVNADEVAVFTNGFPIIAIRGYDTYAVLRDDPGDFGWALLNQDPTSTTTTIAPDYDDANTGIGHAGTDQLSLIAMPRWTRPAPRLCGSRGLIEQRQRITTRRTSASTWRTRRPSTSSLGSLR